MVDWPHDSGGMVVARHFAPPQEMRMIQPAPDWCGVPLETEDLPPLLGTDIPMKSTHWGTSSDVLFWFLNEGLPFGPQPPDELQLEYFVPLEQAQQALQAVHAVARRWGTIVVEGGGGGCGDVGGRASSNASAGSSIAAVEEGRALLLYSELRAVAADDLWLSQTSDIGTGDVLAIAFGLNKCVPFFGIVAAAAAAAAIAVGGFRSNLFVLMY